MKIEIQKLHTEHISACFWFGTGQSQVAWSLTGEVLCTLKQLWTSVTWTGRGSDPAKVVVKALRLTV